MSRDRSKSSQQMFFSLFNFAWVNRAFFVLRHLYIPSWNRTLLFSQHCWWRMLCRMMLTKYSSHFVLPWTKFHLKWRKPLQVSKNAWLMLLVLRYLCTTEQALVATYWFCSFAVNLWLDSRYYFEIKYRFRYSMELMKPDVRSSLITHFHD